jgi:hypothetical protein
MFAFLLGWLPKEHLLLKLILHFVNMGLSRLKMDGESVGALQFLKKKGQRTPLRKSLSIFLLFPQYMTG